MIEMNYGCGSTVNLQDLDAGLTVLYVGVGAGLEALQFAYFTRAEGSVIAVDRVPEMLGLAQRNFGEAAELNSWFDTSFIDLRLGDALLLPRTKCCTALHQHQLKTLQQVRCTVGNGLKQISGQVTTVGAA